MSTTILIVDDSRTIRLLIRAFLVGRRYEFVETADGREALALMRRQPPDLVISDVFMPGLGGFDFVRIVRAEPNAAVRRVPVILVSSKREPEVAQRALESGADAFLNKPIDPERLAETIDELFARSGVPEPISHARVTSGEEVPSSKSGGERRAARAAGLSRKPPGE